MEKIGLIDIQTALRVKFALSDKESEEILAKFFDLIKKALQEEKYVKVKGLGIFKLIEVEPRKSVSVNTGKEIEIQSYKKVTFTPDAQLKELVNKPFAHFEVVELKEDDSSPSEMQTEEASMEFPMESVVDELPSELAEECTVEGKEESEPHESMNMESEPLVSEEELSVSKRKDLMELERLLEMEHNKSRFFLGVIVVLVVLLFVGGLLFFLAPELLERWIYSS